MLLLILKVHPDLLVKLLKNAKKRGLNLVSIEDLHGLSVEKAQSFGEIPARAETTDDVVHVIEWRDGTLLDVIKKPV